MSLLHSLFPGILESDVSGIPNWEDPQKPWSILSDGVSGLASQIADISGEEVGVFIHPSAIIDDFVKIEGPCFIGENVEIRHSAYLRKGSWICKGAVVGHSTEVKNSVLLPNSKAPHFNYVGDSILGFGCNIGAGVKLSNVRNDGREVLVTLGDGSRSSSGRRKLGALVGDNSQLGCNAVTNPGAILAPSSMVLPNETVSGWYETKSE